MMKNLLKISGSSLIEPDNGSVISFLLFWSLFITLNRAFTFFNCVCMVFRFQTFCKATQVIFVPQISLGEQSNLFFRNFCSNVLRFYFLI